MGLGLLGLRSYWLWWIAPPIVASALRRPKLRERAIYVLVVISVGVAALAAVQFSSPADSSLNMYSVWNGEEVYSADIAVVQATGRARVASTFTFPSGFTDFAILVPTLLLSFGLDSKSKRARAPRCSGRSSPPRSCPCRGRAARSFRAWVSCSSRCGRQASFSPAPGRRVLVGAAVAAFLATAAFPDAILGVESRFENTEETTAAFWNWLPSFRRWRWPSTTIPQSESGPGWSRTPASRLVFRPPGTSNRRTGAISSSSVRLAIYWSGRPSSVSWSRSGAATAY